MYIVHGMRFLLIIKGPCDINSFLILYHWSGGIFELVTERGNNFTKVLEFNRVVFRILFFI
jgi:hypothetical protein